MNSFELAPDVWIYPEVVPEATCAGLAARYEADPRKHVMMKRPGRAMPLDFVADEMPAPAGRRPQPDPVWTPLLARGALLEPLRAVVIDHFTKMRCLDVAWRFGPSTIGCARPSPAAPYEEHMDMLPGQYPIFTSLVLYLNTMEPGQGGETHFPRFGVASRPVAGTVILIPPHYTHRHGVHPVTVPRYSVVVRVFSDRQPPPPEVKS